MRDIPHNGAVQVAHLAMIIMAIADLLEKEGPPCPNRICSRHQKFFLPISEHSFSDFSEGPRSHLAGHVHLPYVTHMTRKGDIARVLFFKTASDKGIASYGYK